MEMDLVPALYGLCALMIFFGCLGHMIEIGKIQLRNFPVKVAIALIISYFWLPCLIALGTMRLLLTNKG